MVAGRVAVPCEDTEIMRQEPPPASSPGSPPIPGTHLRELAGVFLMLGTTAFGGPAAHIAMMQQQFVERRKWLRPDEFLDMMAVANLIPGPSSTELAIFVGYRRAGLKGLLVAGCCFILPAALMVAAIAWAYVRYGHLPVSGAILYGVKPVVIAIVVQAIWRLARTAIKTWFLGAIAVAAAIVTSMGADLLLVLLAAGLVVASVRSGARWRRLHCNAMPLWLPPWRLLAQTTTAAVAAAVPVGLWSLLFVFLKVGAVLFGSGYVLLAFLQAELVDHRHWMTQAQLLDAIAVGQVTPGPIFTTATFIGYLLAGPWGAVLATVAIFLPAFIFVSLSGPLLPRLRKSPVAGAFLDGLNVASLALMTVVAWQLGRAAIVDPLTIALVTASLILLVWKQINSVWLVLGGGVLGLVHMLLR